MLSHSIYGSHNGVLKNMYKNGQKKLVLRTASLLSFFFFCFYSFSAFASTINVDSFYSADHQSSIRAANKEDCHSDSSSSSFSHPLFTAGVFSQLTLERPLISIDVINLRASQVPHKLYLMIKSGNSPPFA